MAKKKSDKILTPWTYQGEPFNPTFDEIKDEGWAGFVYLITSRETGRMYIGKKRLTSRRTRPPLKGRKNRRHYLAESDWRTYTGTCKPLNAEIDEHGIEAYQFEILSLHYNQQELNYHEMAGQFLRNVLQAVDADGNPLYYNDNIAQQFYSSVDWHDTRTDLHESFLP